MEKPLLVYDIGMDKCQDTDFYLKKGFDVVAVDANPAVCEMARRRFAKEVKSGRLHVINCAISETSDPLEFFVCDTESMLSTADPYLRDREISRNGHKFHLEVVQGLRPGDLIREFGVPDFAKVDIEGFDQVFLRGLGEFDDRPTYVSTEMDLRVYDDQIALLASLGYRQFAMVNQAAVEGLKAPRPARIGLDVDHTFPEHASGLFGPELSQKWMSADEVSAMCRAVKAQSFLTAVVKKSGLNKVPMIEALRVKGLPLALGWYDIHARV